MIQITKKIGAEALKAGTGTDPVPVLISISWSLFTQTAILHVKNIGNMRKSRSSSSSRSNSGNYG